METEIPASVGVPRSVSIALYVLSAVALILFIILSVMGITTWVQQSKRKKTASNATTPNTNNGNKITII